MNINSLPPSGQQSYDLVRGARPFCSQPVLSYPRPYSEVVGATSGLGLKNVAIANKSQADHKVQNSLDTQNLLVSTKKVQDKFMLSKSVNSKRKSYFGRDLSKLIDESKNQQAKFYHLRDNLLNLNKQVNKTLKKRNFSTLKNKQKKPLRNRISRSLQYSRQRRIRKRTWFKLQNAQKTSKIQQRK